MQYLDINQSKITPQYLEMLLKVKRLTDVWDNNAIGADGRHFTKKTLLNLEIPLPSSLEEQNKIVEAYNIKIKQAEQAEEEANKLETEIENYIYSELGIQKQEKQEKKKGLQFVKFKDIRRWDILYLQNSSENIQSKYSQVKLQTLVNSINKDRDLKSLRISTSHFPNERFYYIGMENVMKNIGELDNKIKDVSGKLIKSQSIRVPRNYIMYGKLRPYLNKYWVNITNKPNVICSAEFFVFSIVKTINQKYFISVLGSSIIQKQIEDKSSGARMPRINEDTFLNLSIPLPPLSKQNEIVEHITVLKEQIKTLRHQAQQNREQAIKDFENTIFS